MKLLLPLCLLAASTIPCFAHGSMANPISRVYEVFLENPMQPTSEACKAVKIVTPLLPHLPRIHRYKIVVMRRPIEEIVRSQLEMLRRAGQPPATDPVALAAKQLEGLEKILALLRSSDRVELLEIDYPALVADPAPACNRLAEFLGPQILPHPEKMPAEIEAGLHRQRG